MTKTHLSIFLSQIVMFFLYFSPRSAVQLGCHFLEHRNQLARAVDLLLKTCPAHEGLEWHICMPCPGAAVKDSYCTSSVHYTAPQTSNNLFEILAGNEKNAQEPVNLGCFTSGSLPHYCQFFPSSCPCRSTCCGSPQPAAAGPRPESYEQCV